MAFLKKLSTWAHFVITDIYNSLNTQILIMAQSFTTKAPDLHHEVLTFYVIVIPKYTLNSAPFGSTRDLLSQLMIRVDKKGPFRIGGTVQSLIQWTGERALEKHHQCEDKENTGISGTVISPPSEH